MVHFSHREGKAQGITRGYQSFTRLSAEFLSYIAQNLTKKVIRFVNQQTRMMNLSTFMSPIPFINVSLVFIETTGTSPKFTPSVCQEGTLYSTWQDQIRASK